MASCPICHKATAAKFRPFCSARCADVDLGRWMTGEYGLPSDQPLGEQEIEKVIEHVKEHSSGTSRDDSDSYH